MPALPPQSDGSAFNGDKALQSIADSGRDWRQNYVRKADMEVRRVSPRAREWSRNANVPLITVLRLPVRCLPLERLTWHILIVFSPVFPTASWSSTSTQTHVRVFQADSSASRRWAALTTSPEA